MAKNPQKYCRDQENTFSSVSKIGGTPIATPTSMEVNWWKVEKEIRLNGIYFFFCYSREKILSESSTYWKLADDCNWS